MKYLLKTQSEQQVIEEKEYEAIANTKASDMIQVGDNFYYRKDVKIYKSGSRPFIRLMGETQSLSELSKDSNNIYASHKQWLARWKKKSPEQKTLIELHNRYGIELSKKLQLSHEFIGYWDNEKEEMSGEFLDVISRFWGLAGLENNSLNTLIINTKIFQFVLV